MEAEKTALAAQAEAEQARSELQRKNGSDRKTALQLEKQRSNELRRKRNQAAQIQTLKDKAEREKLEAQAIREQAEQEVLMTKARLLAEAQVNAQAEAEAKVKEAEYVKAELLAQAEAAARLAQDHA